MRFKTLPEIQAFKSSLISHAYSVPHSAAGHELILVRRGKMALQFSGRELFEATEGDILLIRKGTQHADIFAGSNVVEQLYLHFDWGEECADEFFRVVDNTRLSGLSKNVKTEVFQQLHALKAAVMTSCSPELCAARLLLILLLLYQDLCGDSPRAATDTPQHRNLIQKAEEYMCEHLDEELPLEKIAAFLRISKFHFSRLFRAGTGKTVHAWLLDLRMLRARELLDEGRLYVADVAGAVGYKDANYFSKVFRRYFHYPPSTAGTRKNAETIHGCPRIG